MFWVAWTAEDGSIALINVPEDVAIEEAELNNPQSIVFEARLTTE